MKVLILYSHLAGYFYNCLIALLHTTDVRHILIVCYKPNSVAPFQFSNVEGIEIIFKEDLSDADLVEKAVQFAPDIVYISGWVEPSYLKIGRHMKKRGKPVVMGMDNQWSGNWRQQLGRLVFPVFIRRYTSYIWVAGIYQYEFARRLGFPKRFILYNLYSADVSLFSHALPDARSEKAIDYPKTLLFIGRFVPEKGVQELAQAFAQIKKDHPNDWNLLLVGGGPLKETLSRVHPSISVRPFIQPADLPVLMHRCGVFCLPSASENWGVVLHEAAAAGLPIVASEACGAAVAFVKHGYNGFVYNNEKPCMLKRNLLKIMDLSGPELLEMGKRSYELSKQITPEIWAATLVSVFRDN